MKRQHLLKAGILLAVLLLASHVGLAMAADKKPNIVIIWGDDIGQTNISAYSKWLMGHETPNIDRVAKEGVLFNDYMVSRAVQRTGPHSSRANPACERA